MSDTSTPALSKAARRYGAPRQKVPPFARYRGTSAWKKNLKGAREYARFRAEAKGSSQNPATPHP